MKYILTLLSVFALISCSEGKQNNLEPIDKQSAREVTLKAVVAGDSILHITSQKVWANGQLVAQKVDTLKTPKEITVWGEKTPTTLVKTPIYVTVE